MADDAKRQMAAAACTLKRAGAAMETDECGDDFGYQKR